MVNTLMIKKGKKLEEGTMWSIPGTSDSPQNLVTHRMNILSEIIAK